MKGGNDIKTKQIQEQNNGMFEIHTNRSDENEIAIRKTANYDCEIIHELGNATWGDHNNESNQERIEEEEETYNSLTIWMITETAGKLATHLSAETQALIPYGSGPCEGAQVSTAAWVHDGKLNDLKDRGL